MGRVSSSEVIYNPAPGEVDLRASANGEPLVRIRLVPVEVFGAGEEDCRDCGEMIRFGYGLCDAVQAWSDCNRAIGHIFRKDDDYTEGYREPGDTITVYVPQSEMAKFERRYGDEAGNRCPACHASTGICRNGTR